MMHLRGVAQIITMRDAALLHPDPSSCQARTARIYNSGPGETKQSGESFKFSTLNLLNLKSLVRVFLQP